MKKCGLLGKTLGHSFSPQIHALFGDYEYLLYEKNEEELGEFLLRGEWDGLNVTIPYKQAVMPYCDEISPEARKIGSVNTLVRRDGKIYGYNTDIAGFEAMLDLAGTDAAGKKALVLGSGGASKTAVFALNKRGADVVVISRGGENNYSNLDKNADAALIVNATPVGMYPNTEDRPLDLSAFPRCTAALDLIYNPARTRFLLQAEELGIKGVNGLLMLVEQAAEASGLFTGNAVSRELRQSVYRKIAGQMQNIILIGMPGCGKTTVGRLIAEATGRELIDLDSAIEAAAGKTIPEIFALGGEEEFRRLETEEVRRAAKRSGLVIATGGGVVTREENYPLLHANGTIFFLDRDISSLPIEGRPLSASKGVNRLAAERMPLYEKWCDHKIIPASAEAAAREIIALAGA
jgi:shikimate dehydrogenase